MRFKIDWASLILGRKFTVFLCFTLYLKAISLVQAPGGALRGDITEGFLRYKFGGAYIWRDLFSEFYGIWLTGFNIRFRNCKESRSLLRALYSKKANFCHISPLLRALHWLPVAYRTVFKILL